MHQGILSQDQLVFVYIHYPQYSANPLSIIDWLYGEALRIEFEEEQKAQIDSQYIKRNRNAGNTNITNNEYYDEDVNYDEDSSFGANT